MTTIDGLVDDAVSGDRPLASAVVVLTAVDGEVTQTAVAGTTRSWDDDRGAAAVDAGEPAAVDTVFDLASITKLFTATALLLALDQRGMRDGDVVAEALPELGALPGRTVTFADLLRHTAGWPAEWSDNGPGPDAWDRFRAQPREAAADPHYRYSCVGYIWAGLAVEALTGEPLDAAVRRLVLDPLGMASTMFAPPPSLQPRIAATEYQRQSARGLVHGSVHDETAWALGGVAGNAGMFGTAPDLLRFAELLRGDGFVDGRRVLPEWVLAAMTADRLPERLDDRPAYGQALGPRVADAAWMGALARDNAIGHTGFTGTSMLTTPGGAHSVIILTNRVHPSRHWNDLGALRSRIADEAAKQ